MREASVLGWLLPLGFIGRGGSKVPKAVGRDRRRRAAPQRLNVFVGEHRGRFGVKPICKALQFAPSGYRRRAACAHNPALRCTRALRDAALLPHVQRVSDENLQVYAVKKVWRQLAREGHAVSRCIVERFMRRQSLRGVIRGKTVRITISDAKVPWPRTRSI